MMKNFALDRRVLERRAGIYLGEDCRGFIEDMANVGRDFEFAMDAQPTLVTTANNGIPAYLANWFDPKLIEVLLTPMRAAEILGEVQKGDWTTASTQFAVIESTGDTSSYNDWSEQGNSDANAEFPWRQSYHYQTMTRWGEKEMAIMGLARIDWAQRKNISSILNLNKFQNQSYFFGIANLQNYGLLNDPSLITPIGPAAGVWTALDAAGIYLDIQRLYTQLQVQLRGTVKRDFAGVLAMSPEREAQLTKINTFNVNVIDQIKKNFPNLRIESAPEYATVGGQLVQMIVDSIEGQKTATCAYTEKLRAHRIVNLSSSFKQKKSQGTYGAVIFRPVAIAQLLGV